MGTPVGEYHSGMALLPNTVRLPQRTWAALGRESNLRNISMNLIIFEAVLIHLAHSRLDGDDSYERVREIVREML